MIAKILLIIIYFFSFYCEFVIKDAIYNLVYDDYLVFNYNYNTINIEISKSFIAKSNCNFKIYPFLDDKNLTYYFIEHTKTYFKICCNEKNEISLLSEIEENKKDFFLWNFINVVNNSFILQNKSNKCFIVIRNNSIYCENIPLNMSSQFRLLKIYEEVKENEINKEIIDKEPIDIIIKYIDLKDPFLNRSGIAQIKKDYENEELRYAVRSILKYIPWIRKIFILMPNEKVQYFKDYELIKEKIVYVKDKDLLGYDSSNSHAFQYRYWKMKKFGISDNFIAMDDDYFIGGPLKKTDFFYNENGKVIPAIISENFLSMDEITALEKMKKYLKLVLKNKREQSGAMFEYSLHLTYLFFIKLFNKNIIVPKYTHNAFPLNINELKEIYDLIYSSENRAYTLDSLYRHLKSFQFQAFVISYMFLIYKRKVKTVSYKYLNTKDSFIDNYNYSLLCINTGSLNYSKLIFLRSRLIMEYLFHEKTPYEIINYSLQNIIFDVLYLIEKEFVLNIKIYTIKTKNLKKEIENYLRHKNQLNNCFVFFIFFSFFIHIIKIKSCFR